MGDGWEMRDGSWKLEVGSWRLQLSFGLDGWLWNAAHRII